MYDVIIVGAGFAGCSLASQLDELDILVLDKDGIGKRPVSAITFLDLIEDDAAIRNRYSRFGILNSRGDLVEYDFEEEKFVLVNYEKLCRSKWRDVTRTKVVDAEENAVVTSEGERIKARVIVDCSGLHSKIREKVGFKPPEVINVLRFQKIAEVDIDPDIFYFTVGVTNNGGWIYPISRKEIEFGVATRFKFKERAKVKVPQIKKIGFFKKFNGIVRSENMATIGYSPVKQVVNKNYILLGDSAGMVHPVYGMGIHYIDRISQVCAKCIREYLRGMGGLEEYQKFWSSLLKKNAGLWARGMAIWSLSPKEQEKLVVIQKYMEVHPKSIYLDMLDLDTNIEIFAKRGMPIRKNWKFLLRFVLYRLTSLKFYL